MAIFSLIDAAVKVPSRVVVLDIFRSSNTIIEILYRGADRIIPVESLDEARTLKESNPDWLLFAEREGKRVSGSDGDSSPANVSDDVSGRTVILTTSGGTRCLTACDGSYDVFVGSFINAATVIRYLRMSEGEEPGFWAVGQRAEQTVKEDEACALYLDKLWHGESLNFESALDELRHCDGAQRLMSLGQQDDLEYCLMLNKRDVLPKRHRFNEQLWCLTA